MFNAEELKKQVDQDIEKNFSQYMEEARELVRQPSIASQNIGIHECAEMVAEHIRRLGSSDVRLMEYEEGSPVVYGSVRSKNPKAKTLIIYCLYDVQPPEPLEEWKVETFRRGYCGFARLWAQHCGQGVLPIPKDRWWLLLKPSSPCSA